MKNIIDDNRTKEKILERILLSEGFAKSERYGDLLKYLFDANLQGKVLKETVIALEFFGRDSDFVPYEDPIVRVYIGNVRKKINHFYLTEGKDEKVRLTIPKGHYDISFVEKTKEKLSFSLSRSQKFTYAAITLFLLVLIVSVSYLYIDRNRIAKQVEVMPKSNLIWYEFLNEKKPILVVLGDYFFMAENREDTIYKAYIRFSDVNSLDDYNNIVNNNLESGSLVGA